MSLDRLVRSGEERDLEGGRWDSLSWRHYELTPAGARQPLVGHIIVSREVWRGRDAIQVVANQGVVQALLGLGVDWQGLCRSIKACRTLSKVEFLLQQALGCPVTVPGQGRWPSRPNIFHLRVQTENASTLNCHLTWVGRCHPERRAWADWLLSHASSKLGVVALISYQWPVQAHLADLYLLYREMLVISRDYQHLDLAARRQSPAQHLARADRLMVSRYWKRQAQRLRNALWLPAAGDILPGEQMFLKAIDEKPGDLATWLAWADWLQERPEPLVQDMGVGLASWLRRTAV